MISSELNLNRFTVHQILTQDLDVRRVCAKMVPKNPTTDQKANRRDVCLDLDRLEREPEFLSPVIMDFRVRPPDKTPKSGVAHCKVFPSQVRENEQIQNQIDARFFFFDSQRIVHKESVPPGQTVTQTFYREVLERLRKRVARVRPDIARTCMLHHDNAPCHTVVSINEFLA